MNEHHRSHRVHVSDGQLEIIDPELIRVREPERRAVDGSVHHSGGSSRRDPDHVVALASIREARRLLAEASAHDIERQRVRSDALRRLPPPVLYRNAG